MKNNLVKRTTLEAAVFVRVENDDEVKERKREQRSRDEMRGRRRINNTADFPNEPRLIISCMHGSVVLQHSSLRE